MDFDQNELDTIYTDAKYIECINKSYAAAKKSRMMGDLRPRKIVDDSMIEFYGSETTSNGDTHGKWFSNCVYSKINVNGDINVSSEHYFQRSKFLISDSDPIVLKWCRERNIDINDQIKINMGIRDTLATHSPGAAARYGQTIRSAPIRGDWDKVRNRIMWEGLVAKFTQNDSFKNALLSTRDRVLIERTPTDAYWGVNNAGQGANTLGVMLMALRNLLQE
jgi:ribA/ribD-fused uncharacterized protein